MHEVLKRVREITELKFDTTYEENFWILDFPDRNYGICFDVSDGCKEGLVFLLPAGHTVIDWVEDVFNLSEEERFLLGEECAKELEKGLESLKNYGTICVT